MTPTSRPLRIGLEAGWDPSWPAGLLYVRNLVYALAAVDPARRPEVRLLPVDTASIDQIGDLASVDFVSVAAPRVGGPFAEPTLRARRAIRRWIQPLFGRPLVHAYRGLDLTYPGFGTRIPRTPQMHWIPDFQHVHLPHLFTNEDVARRNERFHDIATTRTTVILSSKAAKADFERLFPDAIATPRVWRFTTTLTERELGDRDPRPAFSLPDTYVYVANQFWAHKDHLTLFRAIASLKDGGIAPRVVCTGVMDDPRDPNYVPRLMRFLDETGLRNDVRLLGFVDRADQLAILRHSAAVVQPSLFEGWSTVVEDAKAVGRPLILSDIAVHLEQAPTATFFTAGSSESLADALAAIWPTLRPGPDSDAERIAFEHAERRRQEAGEEFVSIAEETVARARRRSPG